MDTEVLFSAIAGRDTVAGCRAMEELCRISESSDEVYYRLDTLAAMLDSGNSYHRNRALALIAACAKWDRSGKIAALLPKILAHITDDKPITARQCIQSLPRIAAGLPELSGVMTEALLSADTSKYKDSMRPLIEKDIAAAAAEIGRVSQGRNR